jgi:hypothetical protein
MPFPVRLQQHGLPRSPSVHRIVEVRVPCGTPIGVYEVMHIAGSTNNISDEYNEFDDTSRYPINVRVENCNHASCIWGSLINPRGKIKKGAQCISSSFLSA